MTLWSLTSRLLPSPPSPSTRAEVRNFSSLPTRPLGYPAVGPPVGRPSSTRRGTPVSFCVTRLYPSRTSRRPPYMVPRSLSVSPVCTRRGPPRPPYTPVGRLLSPTETRLPSAEGPQSSPRVDGRSVGGLGVPVLSVISPTPRRRSLVSPGHLVSVYTTMTPRGFQCPRTGVVGDGDGSGPGRVCAEPWHVSP